MIAEPKSKELLGLYSQMVLLRSLETALTELSQKGVLRGSLHLAEGQEALPAGVCAALTSEDSITVTYRGHGYVLAKGCDLDKVVAEILGRSTGLCRGRGGKMHLIDLNHGLLGANGIVAGGIPSAVGAALSSVVKWEGTNQGPRHGGISVAVFGDGTLNQGVAHESFNMAALWKLPVIFLCENNLFAEMTPLYQSTSVPDLAARMAAYNISATRVDGNDVLAVRDAVVQAREKCLGGTGPVFIEAMTYRTCGHYQNDPGIGSYRQRDEVSQWRARSPIERTRKLLAKQGVSGKEIKAAEEEAKHKVTQSIELALGAPDPRASELHEGLFVEAGDRAGEPNSRSAVQPLGDLGVKMVAARPVSFAQAINEALRIAMDSDPRVILLGEDIGRYGGMFRCTEGLFDRFGPKRVWDTPISEAGFIGMALGAALTGLRPVVELMFIDFSLVAMDQILNQVAKTRYMSGGTVKVPMVIRTQGGGYKGAAAQHSQMLEALFLHVPGLKVVAPSNPIDAKEMLLAAIGDDNPVLFIEHKQLYSMAPASPTVEGVGSVESSVLGVQPTQRSLAESIRDTLRSAAIRRPGRDLTIASYSYSLHLCLEAAEKLTAEGIDAEVIDLRSLNPLDWDTMADSVRKTHRFMVVHEAHGRCGFGADLAALVQEKLFDELDAPVLRLCAADVPTPYAKTLEEATLPSVAKIEETARRLTGR